MKRTLLSLLALTLVLAAPLTAQSSSTEPSPPETPQAETPAVGPPTVDAQDLATAPARLENLFSNEVTLGLQGATVDTHSSKFEEYREVPKGVSPTPPGSNRASTTTATTFPSPPPPRPCSWHR